MLTDGSKQKQIELRQILLSMASSCYDERTIRQTATKLNDLYAGQFRHSYSEFFPLIVEISKNETSYSLDYLSNNLKSIQSLIDQECTSSGEFKYLSAPFSKLRDHINLEIGRFSYYSRNEQRVVDLEAKNEELQKGIDKARKELLDAQKKVETVQTELIAVLSIFAAIVLAFSGSISYFSSALSGMQHTNFFKMCAIVLLCGFSVFNLIFSMMYIVGKITRRSIYAKCQSEDCTCAKRCSALTRIRKRLPYVFWFNLTAIALLLLDIVAWCLNMNSWHLPF